ncbi:hypothetical protein EV175_004970, partial [Coemansia sp. RSA 1933]
LGAEAVLADSGVSVVRLSTMAEAAAVVVAHPSPPLAKRSVVESAVAGNQALRCCVEALLVDVVLQKVGQMAGSVVAVLTVAEDTANIRIPVNDDARGNAQETQAVASAAYGETLAIRTQSLAAAVARNAAAAVLSADAVLAAASAVQDQPLLH